MASKIWTWIRSRLAALGLGGIAVGGIAAATAYLAFRRKGSGSGTDNGPVAIGIGRPSGPDPVAAAISDRVSDALGAAEAGLGRAEAEAEQLTSDYRESVEIVDRIESGTVEGERILAGLRDKLEQLKSGL